LIYRHADGVGCVSKIVADTLPGPAQKTFVLYNPVDLERFHPAPERRVSPPLILGAGRLTSVKNFQLLLRAVAILRTRTAIRVAVVGEGPERAALEALARELKLEDVFAAPGYVVDPAPWFQEASVLVSCSRMEGFGNTLIEAMACGTPVVAIDAPGPFREVLGPFAEAGLVAETPQDLAAGIEAALQSPPRPEALRARANAFGLDPCADAYAAALDAVAGEKGRRA
jgi:glycosyltransferase involved in cell wall biosynthesis